MTEATWDAVDRLLCATLIGPDVALDAALSASEEAGLPAINVAPNQGKLLYLLARSAGAASILEVGTLGGYSTIWLARALPPGGRMVTLEVDPRHAEVARASIDVAGLGDAVDVRVGPAAGTLDAMVAGGEGPFDFVFIDADKVSNATYLRLALLLSRPGTVIVLDNVVRGGAVADGASTDPSVAGVLAALDYVAAEPRLTATAVQTVGTKGYDGFLLALVEPPVT